MHYLPSSPADHAGLMVVPVIDSRAIPTRVFAHWPQVPISVHSPDISHVARVSPSKFHLPFEMGASVTSNTSDLPWQVAVCGATASLRVVGAVLDMTLIPNAIDPGHGV